MDFFSERHGFAHDIPIITREAPPMLRTAIIELAYRAQLLPSTLRKIVCNVTFETPDPNNWSERPNVDEEVRRLLLDAAWYDVYDVIERICDALNVNQHPMFFSPSQACRQFESEVNRLFMRRGVGWQLKNARIEYRADPGVATALAQAPNLLVNSGRPTAASELHEAIRDLGRRPQPEVTGAIQHAMAALECVARHLGGTTDTLGELIARQRVPLPPPLGTALSKLWGFASENGRHLLEGRSPSFEEAELVVGLSAVTCQYLAQKTAA